MYLRKWIILGVVLTSSIAGLQSNETIINDQVLIAQRGHGGQGGQGARHFQGGHRGDFGRGLGVGVGVGFYSEYPGYYDSYDTYSRYSDDGSSNPDGFWYSDPFNYGIGDLRIGW